MTTTARTVMTESAFKAYLQAAAQIELGNIAEAGATLWENNVPFAFVTAHGRCCNTWELVKGKIVERLDSCDVETAVNGIYVGLKTDLKTRRVGDAVAGSTLCLALEGMPLNQRTTRHLVQGGRTPKAALELIGCGQWDGIFCGPDHGGVEDVTPVASTSARPRARGLQELRTMRLSLLDVLAKGPRQEDVLADLTKQTGRQARRMLQDLQLSGGHINVAKYPELHEYLYYRLVPSGSNWSLVLDPHGDTTKEKTAKTTVIPDMTLLSVQELRNLIGAATAELQKKKTQIEVNLIEAQKQAAELTAALEQFKDL